MGKSRSVATKDCQPYGLTLVALGSVRERSNRMGLPLRVWYWELAEASDRLFADVSFVGTAPVRHRRTSLGSGVRPSGLAGALPCPSLSRHLPSARPRSRRGARAKPAKPDPALARGPLRPSRRKRQRFSLRSRHPCAEPGAAAC